MAVIDKVWTKNLSGDDYLRAKKVEEHINSVLGAVDGLYNFSVELEVPEDEVIIKLSSKITTREGDAIDIKQIKDQIENYTKYESKRIVYDSNLTVRMVFEK